MNRLVIVCIGISSCLFLIAVILCIFLLPISLYTTAFNFDKISTDSTGGLLPIVSPVCPPGSTNLTLRNVRVHQLELIEALKAIDCLEINTLELVNVELLNQFQRELIPGITLLKIRFFIFDRVIFPNDIHLNEKRNEYLDILSENELKNDLIFLKKNDGSDWTIEEISSGLNLDYLEIKINGIEIITLDRKNGIVRLMNIHQIENGILYSLTNDTKFQMKNLTCLMCNLDVNILQPKFLSNLTSLYLYNTSLFSKNTSTPISNLHTFIKQCKKLVELHLQLHKDPFNELDTSDLIGLNQLKKFSFQYACSKMCLTHNITNTTLPQLKYVYISTESNSVDPKLVQALSNVFPHIHTFIYNSSIPKHQDNILHNLLLISSLRSISFYSYNLYPMSKEDRGSRHYDEMELFLKASGIYQGCEKFILTRSDVNNIWIGKELNTTKYL